MSSRKFTMISPAVFQSDRYLSVSSEARELFFYCLAGPHQTMIGCFRAPDLYIAADLRWEPDHVRHRLNELQDAGLIRFDPATQEIMVDRWFSHSQIATEKHMQGARRMIADINSDIIRERLEDSLASLEGLRSRPKDRPASSQGQNSHLLQTALMKPRG